MSDQTTNAPLAGHIRTPNTEYRFYFFVIFAAAIPFAALGFVWDLIRSHKAGVERGILRRAAGEARTITSLIFSV